MSGKHKLRLIPSRPVRLSTMVAEIIEAPAVHGVSTIADIIGVDAATVRRWARGETVPPRSTRQLIRALYLQYVLPARSMVSSFIPWGLENGMDPTLVCMVLLAVAASGRGCRRCIHSRAKEAPWPGAVLAGSRLCAYGRTYPECERDDLPGYLHPSIYDEAGYDHCWCRDDTK